MPISRSGGEGSPPSKQRLTMRVDDFPKEKSGCYSKEVKRYPGKPNRPCSASPAGNLSAVFRSAWAGVARRDPPW